jgi:hypothetical protein
MLRPACFDEPRGPCKARHVHVHFQRVERGSANIHEINERTGVMSVSASSDSTAEATVLVLEDTHDFEASDGTRLWQIGFARADPHHGAHA